MGEQEQIPIRPRPSPRPRSKPKAPEPDVEIGPPDPGALLAAGWPPDSIVRTGSNGWSIERPPDGAPEQIPIRPRKDRPAAPERTVDAWDRRQIERVEGHLRRLADERRGLHPFGMDGPTCVVDQGIFTLYFGRDRRVLAREGETLRPAVILSFDYVDTDRRTGDVTAEMAVEWTDPTDPFVEFRSRISLTNVDRRDRIAKQIADRAAVAGLKLDDWRRMLDRAAEWVSAYHRGGDPAIVLRDAPEPEHEETALLPPITAGEGATILFGDGGTGKSYLSLALGVQLHTGMSGLFPGVEPTARRRVALLDWEWTAWVHKRRLRKLVGPEMPDLVYVGCRMSLREERDRIRRIIRDLGIEFLIVDSVALAAGGEPESAETAVAFMSTLRELELPALLIAHVTKADAKAAADKPFGSTFWHNSARSTWYAKRGDDALPDGFTVGLFHRKANDAPLSAPIGVRVRFDEERTRLERVDVRDVGNLEEQRPLRFRIADLLRGGPLKVHELADELDEAADVVRRTLNRNRPGMFVAIDRGNDDRVIRWALAARGSES